MIAALIRWSARNVFLIGLATVFVTLAGIYAVSRVPLDAIPDLSDVQVIVYTEYSGQAPQVVEDQVTYPLTTAMLSVPKSRVVRGFSFFGVSFVYVIFEDGTDLYWARSRVLEYLSSAARRLPAGVAPSLGPDATGVGWVYQYVVRGAQKSLAELRTVQDWYIRYGLAKAEGVAEVASVGGFVKQYSVVIDPRRLQALGIPLAKIREALRTSNMDVGGRTVELAETEFAVRGRGYIKGLSDLEQIVVKSDRGVPVLLKDVARIELAPDERRGITEMNGEGEVVSGIVLQRFGENALSVIRNVKDRIAEIAPSLPQGVTLDAVYDRSDLIYRAIDTLRRTLIEESVIVALVCVVFLLHVRSALVAIITLPIGILIAYLCMYLLGLSSNIMSLGGIAIAIGAMVDAAIVMIENAHKHLERASPDKPRAEVLIEAAVEVGPALFRIPEEWDNKPAKLRQKDRDARWTKRHGRSFFGYKNHVNADAKHKLIRRYEVTDAAVHDSQKLDELLTKGNTSADVFGDSAYRSSAIEERLRAGGFKSRIHVRATRKRSLSEAQANANHNRSKIRARVEHVFAAQQTALGGRIVRTIGIVRARAKIGLQNLAYNIRRLVTLERIAAA